LREQRNVIAASHRVELTEYLKRQFQAALAMVNRPDLALAIFAGALAWIATAFLRNVFAMIEGFN
jgi:hypothetical protein